MYNPLATDSFDEMAFQCHYPIHKACRDGDVQSLSNILRTNPILVVTEDCFKHLTPIHWAATFGKLDCIRQIVSVDHNAINIQSSNSFRTPLHCASEAGHPQSLLWLLQAGANPEVKDILGETALHKAAKSGSAECIGLLIATSCNVSTQNSNGQTASLIADRAGFPAIAAFIRQSELLSSEFQSEQNRFCSFQPSRFGRKRTRDMCEGTFKRMRTEDMSMIISPALPMNPMTTSVVEHEKLCRMESGYTNSILDMFSEFHGC